LKANVTDDGVELCTGWTDEHIGIDEEGYPGSSTTNSRGGSKQERPAGLITCRPQTSEAEYANRIVN
jgi:hypothetical protein